MRQLVQIGNFYQSPASDTIFFEADYDLNLKLDTIEKVFGYFVKKEKVPVIYYSNAENAQRILFGYYKYDNIGNIIPDTLFPELSSAAWITKESNPTITSILLEG